MMTSNERKEIFWQGLQPIFEAFADRICADQPDLTRFIRVASNDSFVAGAYISFMRDPHCGDEFVVASDVVIRNDVVVITLDASTNDGQVVAQAQDAIIPIDDPWSVSEGRLAQWLYRCDAFLSENRLLIAGQISRL